MVGKFTTPGKETLNLWFRIYPCYYPKCHKLCSLRSQFGQDRIVRQYSGKRDPQFSPLAIDRKEGTVLEKINRRVAKNPKSAVVLGFWPVTCQLRK